MASDANSLEDNEERLKYFFDEEAQKLYCEDSNGLPQSSHHAVA